YFAGLGLGAAAASRPSARPVRRYALLELGAAAATLWSVAVLCTLALPAAQRVLAASGSAARVGAVGVAVLPATICLGATLPAIGDALVLPGTVGWRGGLLYALNTLGGALGIGATSLVRAALATISGVWIFVRATDGLAYVGMRTGLAEYVMRIVGIAAATAGPAALASGAVLPALWAAYGDRSGAARPIGELAAVNALGAVVGALTAAFVVLPTVGLRGGFFLA